ncbi:hypothetical protein ACFQ2H_07165 [Streptomyces violaceoruber]
MIVLVVLSVVAGGGWLVKVSGSDADGVDEAYTYRGPQPAAHQEPVTPEQRREQTRGMAKPVKPHALPTTQSKPVTAAQIKLLKGDQKQLPSPGRSRLLCTLLPATPSAGHLSLLVVRQRRLRRTPLVLCTWCRKTRSGTRPPSRAGS